MRLRYIDMRVIIYGVVYRYEAGYIDMRLIYIDMGVIYIGMEPGI